MLPSKALRLLSLRFHFCRITPTVIRKVTAKSQVAACVNLSERMHLVGMLAKYRSARLAIRRFLLLGKMATSYLVPPPIGTDPKSRTFLNVPTARRTGVARDLTLRHRFRLHRMADVDLSSIKDAADMA